MATAAAPEQTSAIQRRMAQRSSLRRPPRVSEAVIRAFLLFSGLVSIFTTIGIVVVLFSDALVFFREIAQEGKLLEFFTGTIWAPEFERYGILPLATSTFITSVLALFVAVPLGLSAAIFLSEYATPRARGYLKPILELLAAVPTVVYGYFAVTFMTPLLREIFGIDVVDFYNMASAGLVMGIMIIPLIASVSEDALASVPRALREAAFGLGATQLETSLRVVVPAATSGIAASVILAISRAFGETMIVLLAAGAGPNFTVNPFKAAETITAHIARISTGDLSLEGMDFYSLFALGLVLFVITLTLNLISRWFVKRFREVY
ncbi:MAG: phosphate ABC transporter permease subunit PstC [Anaerolineae bacterium]|nr:phosphate ABC transporter permease subunit PstC [Anaerolineae bacterium]